MTIYDKISDWLKGYTPLSNWLYMNAIPIEPNATSVNSVQGERITKKYIDGGVQRECVFAIDMVKSYDYGTSDINSEALNEVNAFMLWIEQQTLPTLGTGLNVEKLEVVDNVPSLLVNEEQSLAKYQFQCRLTYYDENNRR